MPLISVVFLPKVSVTASEIESHKVEAIVEFFKRYIPYFQLEINLDCKDIEGVVTMLIDEMSHEIKSNSEFKDSLVVAVKEYQRRCGVV